MEYHEHLSLPQHRRDLPRRTRPGGGGYAFPPSREKRDYYQRTATQANNIIRSYQEIKTKYSGRIDPHLIYRIKVNQSVDHDSFSNVLHAMGDLTVLSVAENKKGYWVVFSNEQALETFKNKLAQYSGVIQGNKYEFFNAIDSVEDIPKEDKIGEMIKREPLLPGEINYLNVELWRMDDERLNPFIDNLKQLYRDREKFRVCDQLITNSFALLRIKITTEIFEELLEFKEIALMDRPFIPTFSPSSYNYIDVSEFEVLPPSDDATGVLILDSGIVAGHPLLEQSVGAEESFVEREPQLQDRVGHGTAVAGNAIYGDIEDCIERRQFAASNWLFSAKVMYGVDNLQGGFVANYDPEILLERQLHDAITTFLTRDYNIKAVNLSFGNKYEVFETHRGRQFPLAALVDELALMYPDVVFVISAGNGHPADIFASLSEVFEHYPNYLVDNSSFKIINPATSALALTVGSVAPTVRYGNVGMGSTDETIWTPVANENEPSPFTRTGFGLNGMVKPELVHFGGNLIFGEQLGRTLENTGGKLALLSNNPVEKLFAFDYGTSFSTPKVTNIIGQVANTYPNASANFIKNMVLQSAVMPSSPQFAGTSSEQLKASLRAMGYGLPDANRAIYSFDNRVVLLHEGTIGLKQVQIFSIPLPTDFFNTPGYKRIAVVLTFNPPTRATRGDSYLGNRMEFKLFHSVNPDEVAEKLAVVNQEEGDMETLPPELRGKEIDLLPGTNIRKSGCHQKGVKEYKGRLKNVPQSPFTLAVMNTNKWINDETYLQPYCVSVSLEHSEEINLYELIRAEVQQRVRIR